MFNELCKQVSALATEMEVAGRQAAVIERNIEAVRRGLGKCPAPRLELTGLLALYSTTIRKSAGLTTARPTCLKAIQRAEQRPGVATLKEAVAEMRRHLAEVEKEQKADKGLPAFRKRLEEVIRRTAALA